MMTMSTNFTISKDFAAGALTISSLVVAKWLWNLFQVPSLDHIERIANQPVKQVGDPDQITIYSPRERDGEAGDGIPDFSPFYNRVECYLRLLGQPFVKGTTKDLSENPRRKYPFVNIQGTMVDDSSQIIDMIQTKLSVSENESLSKEQLLQGFLVRRLLNTSLYFIFCHSAFLSQSGRTMYSKLWDNKLPWAVKSLVMKQIMRNEYSNLYGQGDGRYPRAAIMEKGKEDLRAIAAVLGNRKFLLGTPTPTSYDTDVYAFLCLALYDPWASQLDWVVEICKECPKLVDYVNRMKTLLYPDADSHALSPNKPQESKTKS